ncbi:MAG TPA: hypothetical protein VLE89_09060 [Chlamydiales bacterium]|nr:hypothetical protein [Chlamydiales bacterium]
MRYAVALFGEAEKGSFKAPHILRELPQLIDRLGNPPPESHGLFFAVQALLFEREIIFFRVAEEGFSKLDYFEGLRYLGNREKTKRLSALCIPGVGDNEIIDASQNICQLHKSLLITTQKDLYDYLTS